MLRYLIFDFVVPVVLFLLLRSVLRGCSGPRLPGARLGGLRAAPAPSPGGELKKDPVCGTYVSTAVAVRETVQGRKCTFAPRSAGPST